MKGAQPVLCRPILGAVCMLVAAGFNVCQADPLAAASATPSPTDLMQSEGSASAVRSWADSLEKSGDSSGAATVALRGAGRFPADGDL